ncbi:MAG: hypothetical protein K8R88_06175, partial [Armatimonadetes bacterium]|nr:hypothetical protein [Armatimonadota bacterium]
MNLRNLSILIASLSFQFAKAQVLASAGFEQTEGYSLGTLYPQQGWLGSSAQVTTDAAVGQGITFQGQRFVELNATTFLTDSRIWKPFTFIPGNATAPWLRVQWAQAVDDLGWPPTNLFLSDYGSEIWTSAGRVGGLFIARESNELTYFNSVTQQEVGLFVTANRLAWHSFSMTFDTVRNLATYEMDGQVVLKDSPIQPIASPIVSAPWVCNRPAYDKAQLDWYSVTALPPRSMRVKINLLEWLGSIYNKIVDTKVYDSGNQLIFEANVPMNKSGEVTFAVPDVTGPVKLRLKPVGFLSQSLDIPDPRSTGNFTWSVACTPGDIAGDNTIDLSDYTVIA